MLHNHQEHDNNSNHNNITTSRLEAFSDGVMAIIITITVLELKVPHGTSWADILPLVPLFIAYLISFQMVGTYWNNHHHLLKATDHVSAGMMWANLHLLFWLSLIVSLLRYSRLLLCLDCIILNQDMQGGEP